MKRFWMTVSGLVALGIAMSFSLAVEATMQDSYWADIAQGNMMEIRASNLALEHSQNEQVRQFAQQMVTDHTAAGTELQSLATSKHVTLPAELTTKQQSDFTKLGARSGADFDREYMKMMVRDHEKMEKMLDRESTRNADADVKAFAAKTLPVVQGHLSMARTLSNGLNGATTARSASNSNRSNNMHTNTNMNSHANANRSNSNRHTNSNRSNSNSSNSNSNRR